MLVSNVWGSSALTFASGARRCRRAALLFSIGIAVSVPALGGTNPATPASRPWRSVSAPTNVLTLSDYVMVASSDQPDPGVGGDEDSTDAQPREPETKGGTPPTNQPTPPNLPFSVPDTAKSHGDSSFSFPGHNPAASETIGPASPILPFPGGAAARTPVKTRRGIMGLHPIALLVGLVAFHIFIVTVAGK